MFLALKNGMNVYPGPQELHNSKHIYGHDHEPYEEGLHHIYSTLYTLATT